MSDDLLHAREKLAEALNAMSVDLERDFMALPEVPNLQVLVEDCGAVVTAVHNYALAKAAADASAPRRVEESEEEEEEDEDG